MSKTSIRREQTSFQTWRCSHNIAFVVSRKCWIYAIHSTNVIIVIYKCERKWWNVKEHRNRHLIRINNCSSRFDYNQTFVFWILQSSWNNLVSFFIDNRNHWFWCFVKCNSLSFEMIQSFDACKSRYLFKSWDESDKDRSKMKMQNHQNCHSRLSNNQECENANFRKEIILSFQNDDSRKSHVFYFWWCWFEIRDWRKMI
jgi:hypothetical protein